MLCGVNVAANWQAPPGNLDVWVSHGTWSQVTGIAEGEIVVSLGNAFETIRRYEGAHQTVLRIKSVDQAREFVEMLRLWFSGEPQGAEVPESTEAVSESSSPAPSISMPAS